MPNYVILVTGASSGFGQATAEALAKAGHTAYASMQDVEGRNAPKVARSPNTPIGVRRTRPTSARSN